MYSYSLLVGKTLLQESCEQVLPSGNNIAYFSGRIDFPVWPMCHTVSSRVRDMLLKPYITNVKVKLKLFLCLTN
jgi:hypothetical protein